MTFRVSMSLFAGVAGTFAVACTLDADPSESVATNAQAVNTTLVNSTFSDAAGFNLPQYNETLKYLDMNNDGRSDVCGRGSAGIYCALDDGTGHLGGDKLWNNQFSDANGWNVPQGYATIAYPDLNADGLPDVCGRGTAGVYCALSNGAGFGNISLWTSNFNDNAGWTEPRFYSTIQFADLNLDGKLDICGRGYTGIFCALSTGTSFGPATQWSSAFGGGWDDPEFYSTIRLADVTGDGRADVCGRGYSGIYCATAIKDSNAFSTLRLWSSAFSDDNGWSAPEYYSTIQYTDVNFDYKVDVCARGSGGFLCATSTGSRFNDPTSFDTVFSDANGFNQPQYYSTLRVRNGVLCGRGAAGLLCSYINSESGLASGFVGLSLVSGNESDAAGWSQPLYYESIRLTSDFKLAERGGAGIYSTDALSGIAPNRPSNVRAMAASNTSILVTWNDTSSDEGQFNVSIGGFPLGAQYPIANAVTVGANVTSTTIASLAANTRYCFTVRSFKYPHSSATSNVACTTTLPNPPPPTPSLGHIIGQQILESATSNCGTVTYTLDNSLSSTVTGTSSLGRPGLFNCTYTGQFLNRAPGSHTLCLLSQALNTCKPAPVTAGQTTYVMFNP
jgi:hypothetical protein